MTLKAAFASKIREARKTYGYTQAQVAEAVFISTRWYQQVERGAFLPGSAVMLRLLILFELNPSDFRAEVGLDDSPFVSYH